MKNPYLIAACLALAVPVLSASMDAGAAGHRRTERSELVHRIVMKWGGHVQEAYKADVRRWAMDMVPVFANAPLSALRSAAKASTFDAMNNQLLGDTGNGTATVISSNGPISANAIGDIATDLVFVPVAPCRIVDTRLAGGPIAANTVRSFDVTAVSDYSFQGGTASNCGGVGAAGSFAAAAINFTVVTPSGAGYITAFPFLGTQPLAATVNYASGDIVGNYAVVKLDQGASANELSVYSFAQTHLVADIAGYYINPEATALQCIEVDGTPLNLAAGAAGNAFAGACPATYTAVETQCRPSIFGMRVAGSWTSHCNMVNDSAGAGTVTATARCCRIPGR